ncbi:hypothetical protein [Arcticibacterium luteifluviistationis]|uniref:Uncharacterized protein n=1 Tax=Arcticibacterium luteifluviistationis TaxID=1784714 RepID=A0A2Z4G7H7_9BACT|nr:hypothetical protein [Arcticibacterium luteifluviistationis]AWV97107.1 hypothetical protein DJ013_02525 [Arcticibacterium luteifluviistationis]
MKALALVSITTFVLFFTSCSSSKYVKYLKKNTEVRLLSDSLHFNSLTKDFYKNKLFLVGEIHEVETSPRIDLAMFNQINQHTNVDIYLAEMDIVQGYYLQKYLEGSNELSLKEILKNWAVYIGSISEQYRNKWVKMRTYYESLPDDSKFKLIGIDKIANFDLVRKILLEKLPVQYHTAIPTDDEELIAWSDSTLSSILALNELAVEPNDISLLKNIQFNLSNYPKIRSRDEFMYTNFKRYYTQNEWNNKTIYGGFGFAHTLQAYNYTLAGRIKKDSLLPYSNKMVSMNALYVDSRLTVQSLVLPKFLQDKGEPFTRFKFSYDNRLFMYIKGIADYKKVTKPNTISLIKLDAKDSPYSYSARGTKTKSLIHIWDGFDIIDGTSTTDYAQYIFFVRNADWIKPDKE